MVAAIVLLLVFFGMGQVFSLNRFQLEHFEDQRRATSIAQARLESLRLDYQPAGLVALSGSDTTYVVDNKTYTVDHIVLADTPETRATTVTVTVNWVADVRGRDVDRALSCTTILGRSSN